MTTKTAPADPVEQAQRNLADAQQAETDARTRCDDLRAAILAGQDVTAEQLAQAGHGLERAQLGTEAARLGLDGAQRQARADRLAEVKANALTDTGEAAEIVALMTEIEQAVAKLVTICATRRAAIRRTMRALQQEGVPELEPGGKTRTDAAGNTRVPYTQVSSEHGLMAWKSAYMGTDDRIYIDGRTIEGIHPGLLVAAAATRGCKQVGVSHRHLVPLVDISNLADALVNDPARWAAGTFRTAESNGG